MDGWEFFSPSFSSFLFHLFLFPFGIPGARGGLAVRYCYCREGRGAAGSRWRGYRLSIQHSIAPRRDFEMGNFFFFSYNNNIVIVWCFAEGELRDLAI